MAESQIKGELWACLQEILNFSDQEDTAIINQGYNTDKRFRHIDKDIVSGLFDANMRMFNMRLVKNQNIMVLG